MSIIDHGCSVCNKKKKKKDEQKRATHMYIHVSLTHQSVHTVVHLSLDVFLRYLQIPFGKFDKYSLPYGDLASFFVVVN